MDQQKISPALESPDTTATGKQHFEVLDGLRGSAALLVVIYHIQGIVVEFQQGKLLLPHAYLAVDFFFALSGFVIGYAYDDRWGRMSVLDFVKIRIVRLHPLVVLGVIFGLASYLLDPFAGKSQQAAWANLFLAVVTGLLVLPTVPLPNRWLDTHSLNGPEWTLLQEYIGNLAYALLLRRLSTRMLGMIAIVSGLVLTACGLTIGTLDRGYGWDNLWMAPVRLAFPFVTGLWLYRAHQRLPRLQIGYVLLTAVLVVAFSLPTWSPVNGLSINGLYESLCVTVLFPLIVLAGAHSNAGLGTRQLCSVSGRLSYAMYITHFPFLYVWMNYILTEEPSRELALALGVALIPFSIFVAWLSVRYWDEPIRRRLRMKILNK